MGNLIGGFIMYKDIKFHKNGDNGILMTSKEPITGRDAIMLSFSTEAEVMDFYKSFQNFLTGVYGVSDTMEEINVIDKSLEEFRKVKANWKRIEQFLSEQKYPMGSYVLKTDANYLDNVFGTKAGDIGKIVGYDFENSYYRVYFNENQPYQGVKTGRLEKYEGPIPEELKKVDPMKIEGIMVDLR
jgi:hypothetical protein